MHGVNRYTALFMIFNQNIVKPSIEENKTYEGYIKKCLNGRQIRVINKKINTDSNFHIL